MKDRKKTYSLATIMSMLVFNQLIIGLIVFFVLKSNGFFNKEIAVTDLQFNSFYYIKLLWILLPMFVIEIYLLYRYNQHVLRVLKVSPSSTFFPYISSYKMGIKLCSINLAFCALVFTLCQPVKGEKDLPVHTSNAELIFVIDVSSSMNVKDLSTEESRLAIAKRTLSELVNHLTGQRVGIVIFAQQAHVYLPLTTDYEMVQTFVNSIQTSMITYQGTNIVKAILSTEKMFVAPNASRSILVVTDAENHENNIEIVAGFLKKHSMNVSILALSTPSGGFIPNNINKPEFGFKVGTDGNKIISKLNYQHLNSLTSQLNAQLIIAKDSYPDLSKFLIEMRKNEINGMERSKVLFKNNLYYFPLCIFLISILALIINNTTLKKTILTDFNQLFK